MGRPPGSRHLAIPYEQARKWQEKVLKENPGVSQFESSLAITYNRIGMVQSALGNRIAGQDAYQKALEHWDQALKFADDQNVNALRLYRAVTLARLAKHASATAEATEVLQKGLGPRDASLHSARVFALASETVRQDEKLSQSEQNRRAEEYARRAIELLRQAQRAGFFENQTSVNRLKKDTDWEPLRSYEDFVKLVAELERKRKTGAD